MAQAYVKAGLIFLCIIPCLLIVPILFPVFLALGIGVFFSESGKAEKLVKKRREEIEFELPRFVATVTEELMASRDILSMLETSLPVSSAFSPLPGLPGWCGRWVSETLPQG